MPSVAGRVRREEVTSLRTSASFAKFNSWKQRARLVLARALRDSHHITQAFVAVSYPRLTPTVHTIVVTVLGTKNTASVRTQVVNSRSIQMRANATNLHATARRAPRAQLICHSVERIEFADTVFAAEREVHGTSASPYDQLIWHYVMQVGDADAARVVVHSSCRRRPGAPFRSERTSASAGKNYHQDVHAATTSSGGAATNE